MKTTCKKSMACESYIGQDFACILLTTEVVPKICPNDLNVVANIVVPAGWGSF